MEKSQNIGKSAPDADQTQTKSNQDSNTALYVKQINELTAKNVELQSKVDALQAQLDAIQQAKAERESKKFTSRIRQVGTAAITAAKGLFNHSKKSEQNKSEEKSATTSSDNLGETTVLQGRKDREAEDIEDVEEVEVVEADESDDQEPKNPYEEAGKAEKKGRMGNFIRKHKVISGIAAAAIATAIISAGVGYNQFTSHVGQAETGATTETTTGTTEAQAAEADSSQDSEDSKEAAEEQAYQAAAEKSGIDIDSLKKYAEAYGIPADKLGTKEAEQYMRDAMLKQNNVSEPLKAENAEDARIEQKFQAFNNRAVTAEIVGALDSDAKSPDSKVDGLEDPAATAKLYQTYQNDDEAWASAYQRAAEFFDGAEVSERAARDNVSVWSYCDVNNNLVAVSGPENSYGDTTKIFTFEKGTCRILVKNGCDQLMAVAYRPAAPVYRAERRTTVQRGRGGSVTHTSGGGYRARGGSSSYSGGSSNNSYDGGGDGGGETDGGGGGEIQQKDPTANNIQQNAADGENDTSYFSDDAPATGETQTYVGTDGQAVPSDQQEKAQLNAGNTDGDASDGSEYVPAADSQGNISGSQGDTAPAEQDWGAAPGEGQPAADGSEAAA